MALPINGSEQSSGGAMSHKLPPSVSPSAYSAVKNYVESLLDSTLTTEPTRAALEPRLQPTPSAPIQYFDPPQAEILQAVCCRFFPALQTNPKLENIDLVLDLDTRLAHGGGNGWRYDTMPPDGEAYQRGLQGLEDMAQALFGLNFVQLDRAKQDQILQTVQQGHAEGTVWQALDGARFVEELLAELTEYYYSYPQVLEIIGYTGFADGQGWQHIGLNEREDWEKADYVSPNINPVGGVPPRPHTTASPPMRHYALTDEVDAVVIGTGAGGAPLLARLATAGLNVVALEAGKYWQPTQDFATDERAQQKLFWTDERLSAGADPIAFGNNNSGIGVGGSTLHYTAYTPRPQPDDLRLHTEFGLGQDWPIAYSDLEPYYEELEQFLGVSGPSPYPWGPPRAKSYPLAPLPLNAAAQFMQSACQKLGIRTSPAANAALSAAYYQDGIGWRKACTNRGFCQAGCSIGAKASMDVTFVPLALQAGAELRTESFVTRFETRPDGQITSVIYTQNGQEHRQRTRHVFLCAGAVETPRLLLHNDLANSSGQVGRNFMAHTGIQVWGQFDQETRPWKGIPGGLISEDTHRPAHADFVGGYLLQSIGVMPVTFASQAARQPGWWGGALQDAMAKYNHTAGINILGECLPYLTNFLELSDEKDGRGLPKPRIHFSQGENEQRLTAHATKLMHQIWEAAGATHTWDFPRNAHIIGTCRMGSNADSSVVNPAGQSWDIPNLYIVDNSIFPSALSANPALTIMALSLRTADKFLARKG